MKQFALKESVEVYYLLLLTSLGVGILGWRLLGVWAWFGRTLLAGGVVGCVGLIVWQVVTALGAGAPPRMHRAQAAVGATLGTQFLSDRIARSGAVVMLFPPDKAAPTAALDSFYEGFARILTRNAGLRLSEQMVDVSVAEARTGEIPLAAFQTSLENQDEVVAYVSWVGFPDGASELSVFSDERNRPAVYVFDPLGQTNWLGAVREGLIRGGVVALPKALSSEPSEGMANASSVFRAHYRLVTPENLDRVMAELNATK